MISSKPVWTTSCWLTTHPEPRNSSAKSPRHQALRGQAQVAYTRIFSDFKTLPRLWVLKIYAQNLKCR